MKHHLTLAYLLLMSFISYAQPWNRNFNQPSVQNGALIKDNFNTIRERFYEYWGERNVSEDEKENAEEGGYQQFARWEYMMRSRTYPNGQFPDPDILYKERDKENARWGNRSAAAGNWSYIGQNVVPSSGGGTGRINVLRIHPTDPNTLFIGAACGGLWKSTDGGVTWNTTTDLLPSISIADIAINPVNPNIIFVATGDGYAYEVGGDFWGGLYTGGLFVSNDGGNTFSPTALSYIQLNKQVLHRVLINPQNPNIIIACSRSNFYRSVDGGVTWIRGFSANFYDIEFKPGNPDVIYAGTSTRIYKSTDGGATFTMNPTTLGSGRMSIAVTPDNPDVVYVLSENGNLWKSSDEAVTFVPKTSPQNNFTFYGYYDNVLEVSPADENYLVGGGVELIKSTNGGVTWQLAANNGGNDYVHVDQKNVEFEQGSVFTYYSLNDGGIFKTTDGGFTWTDLGDNIYIKQYYRMSSALTNPNIYYAGAQDNGTDQFTGLTWRRVYGGDGMDCAVNPSNANISYFSSQYGNFRKSINGGNSNVNITPAGQSGDWITPIAIDPINNATIYLGYQDLYRSFDNGNTWTAISSSVANGGDITIIKIAPSNNNYIYVGSLNSIKRSTDGGLTFTSIGNGLSAGALMDIGISSSNPNLIWAVFSGYTAGQKVYMSADGGTTWTNVSGSLPNLPVNCVVYQPGSSDLVYVGTDIGIYYRDNSMPDWQPYNTELPNVIISDLEILPSINKLRAATYGRGIWQSDLAPSTFHSVDAGAISIAAPGSIVCINTTSPDVLIKNYGSSALTSANINYSLDGGVVQQQPWSGNLSSLATAFVTLPSLSVSDGNHSLLIFITDPNGTLDPNHVNDTVRFDFMVSAQQTAAPFVEGFEGAFPPPLLWFNDNVSMLNPTSAAGGFGASAMSLKADFYNTINGKSYMISRQVDMTTLTTPPQLTFDVAYVRYNSLSRDSLIVQVSDNCGLSWTNVYAKSGTALSTVTGFQNTEFVPTASQWRHEIVSLAAYATSTNLLFSFVFYSGYGNSLYLDNINIDNSVGIEEHAVSDLNVYPNPADEIIYVYLSNEKNLRNIKVELHDITGRSVFENDHILTGGKNIIEIPVAKIAGGFYYLNILSEGKIAGKTPVIVSGN